jgi:hypothetical protein
LEEEGTNLTLDPLRIKRTSHFQCSSYPGNIPVNDELCAGYNELCAIEQKKLIPEK